jgi:hypothetical protein
VTDPDFSREQRILDLAVRLQTGTANPEEMLEAANSLSYAAGERIALERRVLALETGLAFFMRVLKIFDDIDEKESLWWNTSGPYAPVVFFVMCSDTFDWATADAEPLTPDNIGLLEQSIADVKLLGYDVGGIHWGLTLFCARARGQRPMSAMLIPENLQTLFEAAGPPR